MVPTAVAPALTNIETAFTCQIECQRKGDCTQFTYDTNGKNCYLKPSNIGTRITVANATIGPKSCGYNAYQGNSCFPYFGYFSNIFNLFNKMNSQLINSRLDGYTAAAYLS